MGPDVREVHDVGRRPWHRSGGIPGVPSCDRHSVTERVRQFATRSSSFRFSEAMKGSGTADKRVQDIEQRRFRQRVGLALAAEHRDRANGTTLICLLYTLTLPTIYSV